MKSEEQQQADICCREEVPRVQCDYCNGYEDPDIAVRIRLCEACQNELGRYLKLITALRSIWASTNDPVLLNTVETALKFCGEKP